MCITLSQKRAIVYELSKLCVIETPPIETSTLRQSEPAKSGTVETLLLTAGFVPSAFKTRMFVTISTCSNINLGILGIIKSIVSE